MPRYAILTFGCRVNQADSQELERDLREAGLSPADAPSADVIIVNTCSVTATADQGARQAIRRLNRENPDARMIITGCYATRSAEDVRQLPGVFALVANDNKPELASRVLDALGSAEPRSQSGDGACGAAIEPGIAGRTAWTLRVQTGCEQECAYCIIPQTRGRSRSRSTGEILSEVSRAAAAGFKEVVVTGVHLGSWGRDLSPSLRLEDLLSALSGDRSDVLFRVSSLEPMDCTPAVRDFLLAGNRFAPHFHLPLQHASANLLLRMRRPYSPDYYQGLVESVRERLPHAAIGTDILVGFPGESDADHTANLDWLVRSPLTHVHVFPYSDRPGTTAATLPDKVHGAVVRARAHDIRKVGDQLAARFKARMTGTERPGLSIDDGSVVVTDNYLKPRIARGLPRNTRVQVRIEGVSDGELRGVVVSSAVTSS